MKKLIFPLFVILLAAFVFACGLNAPPEEDGASRSGDDGGDGDDDSHPELPRYVTMRFADYGEYVSDTISVGLGNTVSSPQANTRRDLRSKSRALTKDNAQAFHDYFEAVFYYPGTNNDIVARAVWDIGVTPELRGVHRTNVGINYGNITTTAAGTSEGCAVLFVGSKVDKTLLALGRLVEVDGSAGTTITTATKSVTFEVTPLKAGTKFSAYKADSSFLTSFGAGTSSNSDTLVSIANTVILDNIFIHYEHGQKKFPFFMLNRERDANDDLIPTGNNTTRGKYYFEVETDGAINPTDFEDYAKGIVLASNGWNCEVRNPRYLVTDELYQYSSIFVQDLRAGLVSMQNTPNYTINGAYSNLRYFATNHYPVQFQFVTTNSPDGSVFALVFEFFVYNLTPRLTSDVSLPVAERNPIKWRISPGANQKWLDLDDGLGGTGGAIFLGSGDVESWLNNVPYPGP